MAGRRNPGFGVLRRDSFDLQPALGHAVLGELHHALVTIIRQSDPRAAAELIEHRGRRGHAR